MAARIISAPAARSGSGSASTNKPNWRGSCAGSTASRSFASQGFAPEANVRPRNPLCAVRFDRRANVTGRGYCAIAKAIAATISGQKSAPTRAIRQPIFLDEKKRFQTDREASSSSRSGKRYPDDEAGHGSYLLPGINIPFRKLPAKQQAQGIELTGPDLKRSPVPNLQKESLARSRAKFFLDSRSPRLK